jgi:hypothetical protein
MKKRALKRILIGWLFLVVLVALLGKVSVAATDGGRTAADFLKVGLGAQSAGMGGAFTAVSNGIDAAYWNPAGLSDIVKAQFSLSHFAWLQDISIEQAAAGVSLTENLSVALTAVYVGYGQIQATNHAGPTGDLLTAYDMSFALSSGYRLSDFAAIGLTAKYVGQQFDGVSGGTYAFDLGTSLALGRVTIAAVLANIGPDLQFDGIAEPLPTSVRVGAAVLLWQDRLTLATELDNQTRGDLSVCQGLQVAFEERYFLRAGLRVGPGDEDWLSQAKASLGAGLRYGPMALDYAFSPDDKSAAGSLHRISLTIGLDN